MNAEAQVPVLRDALEKIARAKLDAIAVVRKYGFVFTRAPGDVSKPDMEDGECWEHLAFAFYSDIAALSDHAEQVLDEVSE